MTYVANPTELTYIREFTRLRTCWDRLQNPDITVKVGDSRGEITLTLFAASLVTEMNWLYSQLKTHANITPLVYDSLALYIPLVTPMQYTEVLPYGSTQIETR